MSHAYSELSAIGHVMPVSDVRDPEGFLAAARLIGASAADHAQALLSGAVLEQLDANALQILYRVALARRETAMANLISESLDALRR